MVFVDAHCHLEHPLFEKDVKEIIQRMQKSQTVCVTNGSGRESNIKTLALADGKTVFAACGQDAFHSNEDLEAHLMFLEKNKTRITAIGEIGLDQYHFKSDELPRQKQVFEAQLAFAEKKNLPTVIHSRKAIGEVLKILPSYDCKKVLHYFLEKKHVQKALDLSCFLSLPTVKSKDRLAIIKEAPLNRLLCETDAPFSWPERNEPKNVREVYEEIAGVLKKPLEEIETKIKENAEEVFLFSWSQ